MIIDRDKNWQNTASPLRSPRVNEMSVKSEFLEVGAARIYRLGGRLVSAHLLVDGDGLVLVDSGLLGIAEELGRLLEKIGRLPKELQAILLTHGHLDHTGGASFIQRETGAGVWVHSADREHVEGRVRYKSWARGCGLLESAGRTVMRFKPPEVTDEFIGGQRLPWWGGLRVVHLPGHTPGHCGFYCERTGWLLSGDVFASYRWSVHAPPCFLNREQAGVRASLESIAAMNLWGVIPSHYDVMQPELHARRLRGLASGAAG
jgi:glyoxylase-like metal-dependent hydrolase (beta-lactamase superfamily II)